MRPLALLLHICAPAAAAGYTQLQALITGTLPIQTQSPDHHRAVVFQQRAEEWTQINLILLEV